MAKSQIGLTTYLISDVKNPNGARDHNRNKYREVVNVRNLIKKKMVDAGRDDFINYLAEILGVTRQTASCKLSGQSKFNEKEISTIVNKLGISSDELAKTITKD